MDDSRVVDSYDDGMGADPRTRLSIKTVCAITTSVSATVVVRRSDKRFNSLSPRLDAGGGGGAGALFTCPRSGRCFPISYAFFISHCFLYLMMAEKVMKLGFVLCNPLLRIPAGANKSSEMRHTHTPFQEGRWSWLLINTPPLSRRLISLYYICVKGATIQV
jgi:hypothetical protein